MDSITISKTASGKGLWVSGSTSPHKTQLKEMGGKWNPSKKSWVFSLKQQQELLDYFNLTTSEVGQEAASSCPKPEVKSVTKSVVKAEVKSDKVEILKTKSGGGTDFPHTPPFGILYLKVYIVEMIRVI
jgi:hypothetical protein